jgi:hypothetical protein
VGLQRPGPHTAWSSSRVACEGCRLRDLGAPAGRQHLGSAMVAGHCVSLCGRAGGRSPCFPLRLARGPRHEQANLVGQRDG